MPISEMDDGSYFLLIYEVDQQPMVWETSIPAASTTLGTTPTCLAGGGSQLGLTRTTERMRSVKPPSTV